MPIHDGEVLVVKSGGDIVIDGVLLKKAGNPVCSTTISQFHAKQRTSLQ